MDERDDLYCIGLISLYVIVKNIDFISSWWTFYFMVLKCS